MSLATENAPEKVAPRRKKFSDWLLADLRLPKGIEGDLSTSMNGGV